MTSPIPSERQVEATLRQCLRARWDAQQRSDLLRSLAENPPDWNAFLARAQMESLAPFIYSVLQGVSLVPEEVNQALRKAYVDNGIRNTYLQLQLGAILKRFEEAHLEVVLLKGVALNLTVYADVALRTMNDIDLLVTQKALPRAIELMKLCGYVFLAAPTQPDANLTYENEIALCKTGSLITLIELHWSLFDSPYYQHHLPIREFWRHTQKVAFPQTDNSSPITDSYVRVFTPAVQLLYLCGHLALHHGGNEMLWLNDIAEVILYNPSEINWELVLELGHRCDLILPLQITLSRLNDQWGIPIPESAYQAIQSAQPSRTERWVFAHRPRSDRSVGQGLWDDLISAPAWDFRIHYALAKLFPAPAYMRQRYKIGHPVMLPLYYIYRWYLGIRSVFQSSSANK